LLNLRHIEVFHAIYTTGTVRSAALVLNVSQPSVSKVLRHAESRLGFLLFRRTSGRLRATDEAHALFRQADEIYRRVGSLKEKAKNIAGAADGHIRIATLPGFALDLAPVAIALFRTAHPNVSFDVQTVHHADISRALQERTCDIAIGYEAPRHPRLAYARIGDGELVLLHRPGDLPDTGARVGLSVLEQQDFVSLAHSGPLGDLFNAEVNRQELKLREAVTISTMYVAAALVRLGVGVAVVDDVTARACASADLQYRPLDPPIAFGVHCVYLADRPLSRLIEPFIDTLRDVLEQATRRGPCLVAA
jgi:DNA-binding transcriptional LysR family regulator